MWLRVCYGGAMSNHEVTHTEGPSVSLSRVGYLSCSCGWTDTAVTLPEVIRKKRDHVDAAQAFAALPALAADPTPPNSRCKEFYGSIGVRWVCVLPDGHAGAHVYEEKES